MNKEFATHMLNEDGKGKAATIADAFDTCLDTLTTLVADPRCLALVRTKLEEACFFAKKGMAVDPANQQ